MGSPATVAQKAEYMIADFLTKIQIRLASLRSTVEEVKLVRDKLLTLPPRSAENKALRSQWKKRMGDLADQANGLRKKLSFPFLGLKSKEKFKYGAFPSFEENAFEKEVQLLSSQLSEAEIRINDYLFSPTHTISVERLMEENMLINLYRVHKLSELIEKSIPEEDT
jgi:hypothetical protein